MSLLVSPSDLAARRSVIGHELAPLARSIETDLARVIDPDTALFVPDQKAMLSREGGRCPRDGTMLDFDPFSPHRHRCPACGEWYEGELHHRFWLYFYQLWLAERVVHAAVLAAAGRREPLEFASRILGLYCDLYPGYPNVDNALGPTRPFFSTYLESIWLLQLCVAADLIQEHARPEELDRFRDRVVEPSLALIESFDEGLSNRQVWNNAALMAAHRLLGRDGNAESVVWSESGLVTHLSTALLPDGTWYEGENYHFFAHRGLWYGVQLATRLDAGVPDDLLRRFDSGFRAPFLTALPDLTFPSRRDSQYAVSLRQWRFAEMCELGLARIDDRVLRGMLSRLYAADAPAGDVGRWKSTAEAERNLPPARLDRSDLGWKALLFARPTLTLSEDAPLPSVLLDAQGIGVIRRERGRVYVALDYGVSGGGHGHPDRLNLMVSYGDRRILDDMGTGSYVDPSLHWYRSTLAHNAPMLDGCSQARVDGELIAFEDRGGAGWISARAAIAPAASATRTVVVMPDYFIDEVAWAADAARTFDLPLHMDVGHADGPSGVLRGSPGLEDGFRFAREARVVARGRSAHLTGRDGELWVESDADLEVWRAAAPGPPGKGEQGMLLLRARAQAGTVRWLWRWAGAARPVALFPHPIVESGIERHEHNRMPHGWQVAIHVSGARSTIDLEGLVPASVSRTESPEYRVEEAAGPPPVTLSTRRALEFRLGESAYRRSEQTWREAGGPSAHFRIERAGAHVRLVITVTAEPTFVPPGVENRLDNEQADINGAGVQLYLDTGRRRAGYVVVPVAATSRLHVRPIDGWGAGIPVSGSWRPVIDGYEVELAVRPEERELRMDVVINEKPAGRERRRGQLVMSGAYGETIYLRGDRHDPARLITFQLLDD